MFLNILAYPGYAILQGKLGKLKHIKESHCSKINWTIFVEILIIVYKNWLLRDTVHLSDPMLRIQPS